MSLDDISIRISDYKCFGADGYGYDELKPINLIIGRNNSGKSTLLDLIEYLTQPKDLTPLSHKGRPPKVILSSALSESDLRRVFPETTSGGNIPGNHWQFAKQWIGKPIHWEIAPNHQVFVSVDPPFGLPADISEQEKELVNRKGNPFLGFTFKRLQAERDIRPESDGGDLFTKATGEGATRTIQRFITRADLPSELVERVLLKHLNEIFEPDATFTDIVVRQRLDNNWEIYLEEANKGRIPLTQSGSGVKTVLLVLLFLHLLPHIERKALSQYLFGFEELENNLHPALQRRLLTYLRKLAIEEGCKFFLTSHSSVTIDLFARDDAAQILHVTHDGECASVKRATTYVENRGILDDLDVRASDLLQSNGIIWVEGPSDRLYFNRWMEIWSDGKIKEGSHYQCVYYGGRLLAHLSAADPDVDSNDVVKILRVNRHAILIIDSDRASENESLNATKQRLIAEIEEIGGMAWVTSGREIENYLPQSAIESLYKVESAPELGLYQETANYLDGITEGEGKRFLRNKVLFAERITPFILKEHLTSTLDLAARVRNAFDRILKWNGLSEPLS